MSSQYFDPKTFVDQVIKDCKLGDVAPDVMERLQEAVELRLSDRITATIVSSMGERELQLFNQILEDHSELDEFDAIMMLAPTLPDIKAKLEKALSDLYDELTHDASEIDRHLQMRKEAEEAKL